MTTKELLWITLGPVVMFVIVGCVFVNWDRIGFTKVRVQPMKNSCIANLKQIDGAIQQWALEYRLGPTDTYSLTDPVLLSYMKGSRLPVCPRGGVYLEGIKLTNAVRCNLAGLGHTL